MSIGMGPAPVNVKLSAPTVPVPDWQQQAQNWRKLNKMAGGNPNFYPLTIKAGYVVGIVHDVCDSVNWLLKHPRARKVSYLPAYGVLSAGIELLGRCLNGNSSTRGSTNDLKAGLRWLAPSSITRTVKDCSVLVRTASAAYTVDDLAYLRHFAVHGQAASKLNALDYEIVGKVGPLIGDALERYWHELLKHDKACNRLACANVIALRDWPVLSVWLHLQGTPQTGHRTIPQVFAKFEWSV